MPALKKTAKTIQLRNYAMFMRFPAADTTSGLRENTA